MYTTLKTLNTNILILAGLCLNGAMSLAQTDPAAAHKLKFAHSVESMSLSAQTYKTAYESISQRLLRSRPAKRAIVLDIDDTVLDTYSYQLKVNTIFNEAAWDEWIQERSGTPIAGAKEFLDKIRRFRGMHIVFITDRKSHHETATRDNLIRYGLFKQGDLLLVKQSNTDTKDIRRACVEKAVDMRCRKNGPMPIIALFGDSARDFEEFYGNDMQITGRKNIMSQAGNKYWLLPNAMYGQWIKDYK